MAALWTIYYFKLVNITNVLNEIKTKKYITHCMKSVHIRSFSGLYFLKFGLNMDQKNSEYGHFSCRGCENFIG